jgi:lipopolysaccharide/colanic/teichoic acid biosynthesis glycosyltransferase
MQHIHPLKRTFDLVLVVLISLLIAPFAFLVLVALFLESTYRGRPGDPLFYRETRISAGRPFSLYKFNIFKGEVMESMRRESSFVHTKDLERNGGITAIGWCLKQTYMDELPQLWCVLKGDMSMVGPRPVNTEVYERFMRDGITVKSQIRAGLTGPYQSLKDDRSASAHELDQWYIDYVHSHGGLAILCNDFCIIIRTLRVVIKAKGL